jgi:putative lipoic acid-binding regulatory protein
MSELESIIQYPIDFPIKIMGPNKAGFVETMTALVRQYAPDLDESTLSTRKSREGKYLSITLTVHAVSRQQLDDLYGALSGHPMVSAAL